MNRIIYPGDGSAHINVIINLLVFRPFIGEILSGTVVSLDENGLKGINEWKHDWMILK